MKRIVNQRETTMNAKQAKFLRKNARDLTDGTTGYVQTKHRERLVKTGGLNADGTPQLRAYTPITLRNEPNSFRGVYRTLKKLSK